MELDYQLKRQHKYGLVYFFVNAKKLTVLDFVCYMQYEYFITFFVSVLIDLLKEEKYKTLSFTVFDPHAFEKNFEIRLSPMAESPVLPSFAHSSTNQNLTQQLVMHESLKYVTIMKENNLFLFIPNSKKKIDTLMDLLTIENKIFFQKILKIIFDKLYLLLKNKKTVELSMQYHCLIFFLKEN